MASALDSIFGPEGAKAPKGKSKAKGKKGGSALDAIFGPSKVAPKAEQSKGAKALGAKVEKVEKSGDKSAIAKAKRIAGDNVGSPLMKLLEVADLPRAAVVSAVDELGDALGAGRLTSSTADDDDEASFGDWLQQTKDHHGFGNAIEHMDAPLNVKRGLGFVGDVALDPLTYVAPEAKLATLGKKGVSRALLDAGTAQGVVAPAAKQASARVAKRGISAASDEELRAIGARGGVYLNVPGTGRVGKALGLVSETKQVRIAGRGPATRGTAMALQGVAGAARGTKAATVVENALGGDSAELRRLYRSGDPEKSEVGLRALDESVKGRGRGRHFESVWGEKLRPILRAVRKSGTADAVMEGARGGRVQAGTEEQVEALRGWFRDIRNAANSEADEDFIAEVEDYVFRMRTEALNEKLGGRGGKSKDYRPSGPETRRELRVGTTFLGEELLDPKVVGGRSVEKQADDIAKKVFGDQHAKLFEDDINEVTTAYLKIISKRVGEKVTEKGLKRHGIIRQDGRLTVDPKVGEARKLASDVTEAYEAAKARSAEAAARVAMAEEARDGVLHGPPEPWHQVVVAEAERARKVANAIDEEVAELEWRHKLLRSSQDAVAQQETRRFDEAQAELEQVLERLEVAQQELQKAELAAQVDAVQGRQADALRAEIAELEAKASELETLPAAVDDAEQRVADLNRIIDGLLNEEDEAFDELVELVGEPFPPQEALNVAEQLRAEAQAAVAAAPAVPAQEAAQGALASATPEEIKTALEKLTEVTTKLKRLQREGHTVDEFGLDIKSQLRDYRPVAAELREAYKGALERKPDIGANGGVDNIDQRRAALAALGGAGQKAKAQRAVADLGYRIQHPDFAMLTESDRHLLLPLIHEQWGAVEWFDEASGFLPTQAFDEMADEMAQWALAKADEAQALHQQITANGGDVYTEFPDGLPPGIDVKLRNWSKQVTEAKEASARLAAAPEATTRIDTLPLVDLVQDLHRSVNQLVDAREGAAQAWLDNELRLAQLDLEMLDDLASAKADKVKWRHREQKLRLEAQAMMREAEKRSADAADADVVEALRLQAQAKLVESNLAANRKAALDAVSLTEKQAAQLHQLFADGFSQWGPGLQAPEYLVEAMQSTSRVVTPEGLQTFLHGWDRFHALWKAYAIATPGFHFRNTFGGAFNNYLAGIDHGSYRKFIAAATGKATPKEQALYQQLVESGMVEGGQTAHEIAKTVGDSKFGSAAPWKTNFAPLKGSRAMGTKVENLLRGALGMHVLREGGTIEDALDAIAKYHFDYDDLSGFERNVARRVIPFYTWTRKNLPLQVEEFIRQPQKYTRYLHVKRNVELGQEEDDVVPSYFGEGLGIKLPIEANGASMHVLPDLPFAGLAEQSKYLTDPARALENASPLIKMPLELNAGKQFFADLPISDRATAMPGAWVRVPGLAAALDGAGLAKKDKNGAYIMSARNAYKLEQLMPLFGRSRRLFPSEEKYDKRFVSTVLSFGFGVGTVTNTPQAKDAELARRNRELQKLINDLKDRKLIVEEK